MGRVGIGIAIAFVLNGVFFYSNYQYKNCWVNIAYHEQLAQSIIAHHTLQLVDDTGVASSDNAAYEPRGTRPFPINDTPGYGILLALSWLVTGWHTTVVIQVLQILMYLLCFYYALRLYTLLASPKESMPWAMAGLLCFLPLYYLNVQFLRDIWAYYGIVIGLYCLIAYSRRAISYHELVLGAVFFAFCQGIRPALYMALLTITVAAGIHMLYAQSLRRHMLHALATLWCANIIFFWIPFCAFNYCTYQRLIVGPAGQDLLEGLGEYPNPWQFQLSDEWCARYIGVQYGLTYGTPAFDDAARAEFIKAFKQDPWFYMRTVIKRIPSLILPALPWMYSEKAPYQPHMSVMAKLTYSLSSWRLLLDFIFRNVLIRLLLLCGYAGIVIALYNGQYDMVVWLLIGIIAAGAGKLPSHIENRYLMPFYWPFALLAGYAWYHMQQWLRRRWSYYR